MVSADPRARRRLDVYEEPISFDGIHTYQLIIKSRAVDFLASNAGCFRNCKVTKLRLDGSSEYHREMKRHEVEELPGFSYSTNTITHMRFDGILASEDGVVLIDVLKYLKHLNPSTLYILEMDVKTESGMLLKFRSRQMKIAAVTERLDKSKNTLDAPLVLKYIYDVDTLREVRKEHFGRKLSFILVGEKGTRETTVYKILDNGDD